ncbi:ubiquinol-cytochrome-c reductase complex assembly factor 1 [Anopheles nili]|uniref:ubiquinol-cytochrome-c reductase complex assembly factor 1 n=1 Tax=Anopheles nili TaxID=185578 RepID=UPI00237A1BB3|nr:ubiquinol-cytochrome-c reductase complex assembly factor 1 [Anopheles nili]
MIRAITRLAVTRAHREMHLCVRYEKQQKVCGMLHQLVQSRQFTTTGRMGYSVSPTNINDDVQQPKEGLLKRFIKKMGWIDNSSVRLRVSSCLLYESVVDHINYAEFFECFNMPDTFNTWFLITELHVWMLLVRAMAEGAEKGAAGRFMRNCIVETMWNDVTTRAKQLTLDNPSVVRPQIQQLSEQFQAALISYDEGISFDDKQLAAALWRRFLGGRCEDYEKLELLVGYVRKQISMLDHLSRYDFAIKPTVKWASLAEPT